jgi:hypothetical protein
MAYSNIGLRRSCPLSLVRGGLLSGLLDRRTVAGFLVDPKTNCGQQRYDDDDTEQQSRDI